MFEKIVLRRSENGAAISAGELAESLLFYQNVHIVLDYGSMLGLTQQIGMPTLLSLLSRPSVSATYTEDMLTIFPEVINSQQYYSFESFHIVGNEQAGTLNNQKKRFEFLLSDKCGYSKKQSKNYHERFRRLAPFRKLNSDHYIKGGLLETAYADLLDGDFIKRSVRLSLENCIGKESAPTDFLFKVHPENGKFKISTDLNFEELSYRHKALWGQNSSFNVTNIMLNILNARNDLILASYFGGEVYTSHLSSKIIELKCRGILSRAKIDQDNITNFSTVICENAPRLKDAIDSKAKSFDEFLKLLDRAEKFKSWLVNANPEQELLTEYISAISNQGWIQSTPSKVVRFVISSIAGVAEPLTGNAVSIADSFLVEKILGGWKPNQFVNKHLKPFVDEE